MQDDEEESEGEGKEEKELKFEPVSKDEYA